MAVASLFEPRLRDEKPPFAQQRTSVAQRTNRRARTLIRERYAVARAVFPSNDMRAGRRRARPILEHCLMPMSLSHSLVSVGWRVVSTLDGSAEERSFA